MLGLESSHSKLELRVRDWNRFSSNKSLGFVTVDLSKLRIGTFYDDWHAMDTQGELRVMIHLSRLNIASPLTINTKLPKIRVHLERNVYYPGETIRGCLVMSTSKTHRAGWIKIIVEGASSSIVNMHVGQALMLAASGTILGDVNDKTKVYTLGDGLHLYPFECALPLNIPHTYRSGNPDRIGYIGSNVNLYRVAANIDVVGTLPAWSFAPFRVLAHPMHAVLDPYTYTASPSLKEAPVHVDIEGPSTAWCGEQFTMRITIANNSDSAIDHFLVVLKVANWVSGKYIAALWKRVCLSWYPAAEWKHFPGAPGSSIAPGQTWTKTISFTMPSDLNPSMPSTISPLLQNAYQLKVQVGTSTFTYLKTTGNKRMAIAVSDHYPTLDEHEPPIEPVGAIGKIIFAPATPDWASKIVPAPKPKDSDLAFIGGSLGSVAAMPGAQQATPAPHTEVVACPLNKPYYPSAVEWTPGAVPAWMDPAKEDLYKRK